MPPQGSALLLAALLAASGCVLATALSRGGADSILGSASSRRMLGATPGLPATGGGSPGGGGGLKLLDRAETVPGFYARNVTAAQPPAEIKLPRMVLRYEACGGLFNQVRPPEIHYLS